VRVVDFGLATQVAPAPSDRSHRWFTEADSRTDPSAEGVVAGTPPYMSPEQLRNDPVDARSDQFGFCVALFRALYHVRPYPGSTMDELLDGMERCGRPIDVRRRVPAAVHRAILRGLSIDPAQRWPNMDALLAALEPRRSRLGMVLLVVGATAAVGAVAIAGVSPATAPCELPERARDTWSDDALQRMHAALTESGLRYTTDTWARFGPRYRGLGERWTMAHAEVCESHRDGERDAAAADRAMACLQRSLESARMLAEVIQKADAASLRRVDDALAAVEDPGECLQHPDALEPADPPELQPRLRELVMLERLGRLDEALAIADELEALATDEPQWRLRVRVRIQGGSVLAQLGRYADAVERLRAAALEARAHRDDLLAAQAAIHMLLPLGESLQRPDEAQQWLRFAEASLEAVEGHDEIREALHVNYGGLLLARGDHAAALDAYERASVLCEQGDRSGVTDCSYITLASCSVLEAMGRYDEATERYERALARYADVLGPWHPALASPIDNLGIVLFRLGDYEGSARQHARSLEIREAALGPDSAEVGLSLTNLGLAELALGRLADAGAHQRRAVDNWRASLGEEHPYVAAALTNLALVLAREGASDDEVIALHRQALHIREASLGPQDPEVGTSLANLGNALRDKGETAEARLHLDRALAVWTTAYGPGHPRVATIELDLGDLAGARRAWDEALPHYERALQIFEAALGPDHVDCVWTRLVLGDAELERDQPARAKPLLERAHRELEALPTEIYRRAAARFALARLRAAEGEPDEARALAQQARALTLTLEATDADGPKLRARIDAWQVTPRASAPMRDR
jgi:tetratricopeptide (TPR) repeat protein